MYNLSKVEVSRRWRYIATLVTIGSPVTPTILLESVSQILMSPTV